MTFKLNLIPQFGSGKSVFQTEGTANAKPGVLVTERSVWVQPAGRREILGEITQLLIGQGRGAEFYSGCNRKPFCDKI